MLLKRSSHLGFCFSTADKSPLASRFFDEDFSLSTVQGCSSHCWAGSLLSLSSVPRENLFQHRSRNRSFVSHNLIPSYPYSCLPWLVLKCETDPKSLTLRISKASSSISCCSKTPKSFYFVIVHFLGLRKPYFSE